MHAREPCSTFKPLGSFSKLELQPDSRVYIQGLIQEKSVGVAIELRVDISGCVKPPPHLEGPAKVSVGLLYKGHPKHMVH